MYSKNHSRLLQEFFEEHCGERATIISAQLPVNKWHELFEGPTVADAILDRLVHNSHRIELKGPSLRSTNDKSKETDTIEQNQKV